MDTKKQTAEESLDEALKLVAPYKRPGESFVDELLAERRWEAQLEEQDAARYGQGDDPS
jgi:hypothetical protein